MRLEGFEPPTRGLGMRPTSSMRYWQVSDFGLFIEFLTLFAVS